MVPKLSPRRSHHSAKTNGERRSTRGCRWQPFARLVLQGPHTTPPAAEAARTVAAHPPLLRLQAHRLPRPLARPQPRNSATGRLPPPPLRCPPTPPPRRPPRLRRLLAAPPRHPPPFHSRWRVGGLRDMCPAPRAGSHCAATLRRRRFCGTPLISFLPSRPLRERRGSESSPHGMRLLPPSRTPRPTWTYSRPLRGKRWRVTQVRSRAPRVVQPLRLPFPLAKGGEGGRRGAGRDSKEELSPVPDRVRVNLPPRVVGKMIAVELLPPLQRLVRMLLAAPCLPWVGVT